MLEFLFMLAFDHLVKFIEVVLHQDDVPGDVYQMILRPSAIGSLCCDVKTGKPQSSLNSYRSPYQRIVGRNFYYGIYGKLAG
ncbi:hypothetical protein Trydic_g1892 [Trypoxylus dichotomus]